jgi:hypothetical protein
VSPRDLLHRLVDDLDEADAMLVASLVSAMGPRDTDNQADIVHVETDGRLAVYQLKTLQAAVKTGRWSARARDTLREYINNASHPRRGAVLLFVLLSQPPVAIREEILHSVLAPRDPNSLPGAVRVNREENVADALGSIRAEGLEPSNEAHGHARAYAAGEMTADELSAAALERAHSAGRR